MQELRSLIQQLRSSYQYLLKPREKTGKSVQHDFSERKREYALQVIRMNTQRLKKVSEHHPMRELVMHLEKSTPKQALIVLEQIAESVAAYEPQQNVKQDLAFTIRRVPEEIADDVTADLEELEKGYAAGCYRSCIILCGRLLEHGLHRIYFEATGVDILEKNPGIGLGTLIAKLAEQNFQFEPGMSQQIHLINQIRIYSVHKKHNAFYPSKEQTHATILYTLDALNKLFKARP